MPILEYTAQMIRISVLILGLSASGLALAEQGKAVRAGDKIRDCSNAADEVLSKTKGRLLSVRPGENSCIVTVIVPHGEQRPEKVVVPVDYIDNDSSIENGQ